MRLAKFAVAAVAGLAVAYLAYPFWTLHRIDAAADARDVATLEELVNWPLVRQGVKEDLNALMTRRVRAVTPGGAAMSEAVGNLLVGSVATPIVDRAVDLFVTPRGIAELVGASAQGRTGEIVDPRAKLPAGQPAAGRERKAKLTLAGFSFASPVNLLVGVKSAAPEDKGKPPVRLRLQLDGVTWRLTRVYLPVD